jgi:hypothetical protein
MNLLCNIDEDGNYHEIESWVQDAYETEKRLRIKNERKNNGSIDNRNN